MQGPFEEMAESGVRDRDGDLESVVREELDAERVTSALREQVRVHPLRTLAIAALGGLVLGKLLGRS